MFAFALWDRNRRRSSSRVTGLGVKPMFYAWLPGRHADLRVRAQGAGGAWRVVDRPRSAAIEDYFALGYIPSRARSIRTLPSFPGAYARRQAWRGQPSPREYWDVRFTLDSQLTEREAQEELIVRLRESVRLRMIADVPLGPFFPAASIRARSSR
jgi:asparagine synthase (glutamine-hydrolysing)